MASSNDLGRIDALTGIRALAAFAVVGYHFNAEFSVLIPGWLMLDRVVRQGGLGVDLFFLLSGFILTHTYWSQFVQPRWSDHLKFIWFRFARVYPAYLAALLAAVGIVVVAKLRGLPFNASSYPMSALLPEFLMVLGWWDPVRLGGGWNYPDWSVSAEWFAYLFVFPMAMVAVHRFRSLFARLVFIFIPMAVYAFASWREVWPISRSLSMVCCLFLAGSFLRAVREQVRPGAGSWRLADLWSFMLCSGALSLHRLVPEAIHGLAAHVAFAALIMSLSLARGPLIAFFSSRVVVYFGEISYSLYLSHGVVQRVLKVVLPVPSMEGRDWVLRLAVGGAYWLVILASAMLLYHFVEKPGRDVCRRLYESRRLSSARNQPIATG